MQRLRRTSPFLALALGACSLAFAYASANAQAQGSLPAKANPLDTAAISRLYKAIWVDRSRDSTIYPLASRARQSFIGDSVYQVAERAGSYWGMKTALKISDISRRGRPEAKKAVLLRLAALAQAHGDTIMEGTSYGWIGRPDEQPLDSGIHYLRKAIETLRPTTDSGEFRYAHFLLLDRLWRKNDLYSLYTTAHDYLQSTRTNAGPYFTIAGYNALRHVHFRLGERDSSDRYMKRMRTLVDEIPSEWDKYLYFWPLMSAYLESGSADQEAIAYARKRLYIDVRAYRDHMWTSGALDTLRVNDRLTRYRDLEMEGGAAEYLGKLYLRGQRLDSAVYFLRIAHELTDPARPFSTADHFLGKAEFAIGDYRNARVHLENALNSLNAHATSEDLVLAHQYLFKLDSVDGQWEQAAAHLQLFMAHNDSLRKEERQNDLRAHLFAVQMKDEQDKAEAKRMMVQTDADNQRKLRNLGFGVAGIVLLLLGGLWRQRNRIAREKKRSEELLLNILPAEVAEELKAKGEADAKQIDQVTVLFTDFKGFTAMSEKLTAKELVADIHECFSAFDRIMEKYGIEKIKTIGDAYMAAGGLPTPNTTHALDVVKAAFEIRDFIAEGKAHKMAAGLPYFEIRIGIHTGPVVAGIVGVKKFAYDIWGDTVNIASRMESSGEVGQVNISESTYALVKNETGLTFTSRGKVQAKGKGEMEMYFVHRPQGGTVGH